MSLTSSTLYEQTATIDNTEYLILAENIGSSFYKSLIIYKNKVIKPTKYNHKLATPLPDDGSIRLLLTHRDNKSILFISVFKDKSWIKQYDSVNGDNDSERLIKVTDIDYYRSKFPQEVKWLLNKDLGPKDFPGLPLKVKLDITDWT